MIDFWGSLLAALIGGLISAGIAFGVFFGEKRRDQKNARHEAKRLVVTRMLDVIDQAIQAQRLPPLIRLWRNPDVALILTLPRLMIDLPKEDLPVASWVARQVQLMAWERSGSKYIARATQLSAKLVSWFRGDVAISWFEDQNAKDPLNPNWKPTLAKRLKPLGRDTVKDTTYIAIGAAMYGVIKEGFLPVASAFGRWVARLVTS